VNDVSGLRFDPALAAWSRARSRARARPLARHARDDAARPHYDDVIAEVAAELRALARESRARAACPTRARDRSGIGFGKRAEDNHALLARIGALRRAVGGDLPVLVGPSRKRFLGARRGDTPVDRDAATHAACAIAVYEGADAVRVHDVAGAVRARARCARQLRERSVSGAGMIESLWGVLRELLEYFGANFDPVRDVIDIVLVTIGIYWLLILIRGTRAFQILLGLLVLYALSVASRSSSSSRCARCSRTSCSTAC
jgi:hypothetical protein